MYDFLAVESEIRETIWAGDPAVDIERSNLMQWRSSGEGLILKPQEKATKIRYRDLAPIEKKQASILAQLKKNVQNEVDPMVMYKYMEEHARFGLLSIEGQNLGRRHYDGVQGIDDEDFRKLSYIVISDPMPDGSAMNPVLAPIKGLEFLGWLGALISARSFRDGQ
jgi:hypothetical protein